MKTGTTADGLRALRIELVVLAKQIDRVLANETIAPGDRLDIGQGATNIRNLLHALESAGLVIPAATFQASKEEG